METEGNSNASKVVKEGGDGRQVGEGVVKSQGLTRLRNALASMSMLMEGNKSKEGGAGRQEGEGILVKKQPVAMGMDVLDCPMCSTPLSPPIFQVMALQLV